MTAQQKNISRPSTPPAALLWAGDGAEIRRAIMATARISLPRNSGFHPLDADWTKGRAAALTDAAGQATSDLLRDGFGRTVSLRTSAPLREPTSGGEA